MDPNSHFPQARQPVIFIWSVTLYVTCNNSWQEWAGNSCNIREKNNNRPIVKETSVKQWINSFEHHNTPKMTCFSVIVWVIRSNNICRLRAARLNYFILIQVCRALNRKSDSSVGDPGIFEKLSFFDLKMSLSSFHKEWMRLVLQHCVQ